MYSIMNSLKTLFVIIVQSETHLINLFKNDVQQDVETSNVLAFLYCKKIISLTQKDIRFR